MCISTVSIIFWCYVQSMVQCIWR